ncbi:hypothetical protein Tco_1440014 [Tanacetum coccineum]
MSTLVFVDPKSSTQADGAQSSRVPAPLPEDPYEDIRQAYLVRTDTESEPFEDLGTESPESPYVVASPIMFPDNTPPVGHVEESEGSGTSSAGSTLSDSTTPLSPDHPLTSDTPVLVPSLRRTARMAVRVQPVLSPGYSARIAEATSMSDVAFHKSEEDELGDEEVSLDSNSGSEDAKDEGPVIGDEDPSLDDKGYGLDDESRGIDDKGHSVERGGLGLEEEDKAAPDGQQHVALVMETTVGEPLGLGYGALGRQELTSEEDQRYSTFETPPSPDWTPGSLPISPSHSYVPSLVSSPLISLTVPSPVATPTATIPVDEDQFIDVGAQLELYGSLLQDHTQRLEAISPSLFAEIDMDVRELYTRSGAVRDEIFSQRYRLRSLEQE